MLSLFNALITARCDAPEPWLIGFQDGASPTFEGITELHNTIFFYLIVIGVAVGWMLCSIVVNFNESRSPIAHRYANHGTLIEVVWTVTPALVLVAIAFPSFKLLYLMDFSIVNHNDFLMLAGVSMKILPVTTCTAIVPLGEVGSTLKISFTHYVRKLIVCPPILKQQLIGHLLGDGSLAITRTSITPYFVFVQSVGAFQYAWYVYTKLSHFCNRLPGLALSYRKGALCQSLRTETRSLHFFGFLHNLFYKFVEGKWIKYISPDLISYMTPCVLAFWIMDDGTKNGTGLVLCTSGFTIEDTYRLAGMLHYNFGFKVTHQKVGKGLNLRISSKDIALLRKIVMPYMHSSMMYKISLLLLLRPIKNESFYANILICLKDIISPPKLRQYTN